jgi:predicted AlkP superfamily pyrophosphatase or phosphodiesterase
MRRILFVCLFFILFLSGCKSRTVETAPPQTRLVVVISIDQLAQDIVERSEYLFSEGGIKKLMTEGAWFPHCNYAHACTVTGVGHSIIGTGCYPHLSGIAANDWLSNETGKWEYCVQDPKSRIVDNTGVIDNAGPSPVNLKVETLGDQLRSSTDGKSKVWSISLKDRVAVLMGGHVADGALWFRSKDGDFVSSTYYGDTLPDWCIAFNKSDAAEKYFHTTWDRLLPVENYKVCDEDNAPYETGTQNHLSNTFPKTIGEGSEKPDKNYFNAMSATPFGNQVIIDLAETAVRGEALGRDSIPDILWLGFSSFDKCGHLFGPQSHEILDMTVRLDRQIAELLRFLDETVGLEHCLIALTADHGVCPAPESKLNRSGTGGRIDFDEVQVNLEKALSRRFAVKLDSSEKLIEGIGIPWIFYNEQFIQSKGIHPDSLVAAAIEELSKVEGVDRVLDTRTADAVAAIDDDNLRERIQNNFWPGRSGQLYLNVKPGWLDTGSTASHGTVYDYDTHVPLVFYGHSFKQGRYDESVSPCDLAVTLAAALGLSPADSVDGHVLKYCMK